MNTYNLTMYMIIHGGNLLGKLVFLLDVICFFPSRNLIVLLEQVGMRKRS